MSSFINQRTSSMDRTSVTEEDIYEDSPTASPSLPAVPPLPTLHGEFVSKLNDADLDSIELMLATDVRIQDALNAEKGLQGRDKVKEKVSELERRLDQSDSKSIIPPSYITNNIQLVPPHRSSHSIRSSQELPSLLYPQLERYHPRIKTHLPSSPLSGPLRSCLPSQVGSTLPILPAPSCPSTVSWVEGGRGRQRHQTKY